MSLISGLWPKPEVLLAIESCVFRDPWANKSQPFDLAAFTDLLLLHGVAQSDATDTNRALDIDLTRLLPGVYGPDGANTSPGPL